MSNEEIEELFKTPNESITEDNKILQIVRFVNENNGYKSLLDKIDPKCHYKGLYPNISIYNNILSSKITEYGEKYLELLNDKLNNNLTLTNYKISPINYLLCEGIICIKEYKKISIYGECDTHTLYKIRSWQYPNKVTGKSDYHPVRWILLNKVTKKIDYENSGWFGKEKSKDLRDITGHSFGFN